jgi:hypothetical protein
VIPAPAAISVAATDLMVLGLLAIVAFGLPGIAALAWLKLRGDPSDAE